MIDKMTVTKNLLGYKPVMAIVMYDANKTFQYAESYDLTKKGMAPMPLSIDSLKAIAGISRESEGFFCSGYIPSHILHYSLDTITWTKEPSEIIVRSEKSEISRKMPKMMFHWTGNNLYAFVVKGKEYASAPLPNTYPNGKICLGTVKIDSDIRNVELFAKHCENKFLNAEFNSYHQDQMVCEKFFKGEDVLEWEKLSEFENRLK